MPKVRKTLSGKRIPREQPRRTWHEIVPPQPATEPKQRTGAFYDAMAALPTPESLAVTESSEGYRGGRARRRSKVYTTDLHLRLGAAWLKRRHRLHPVRLAQRQAEQRREAGTERRAA